MRRPKIGVALGSGGAKGFAHIGFLKVLNMTNNKYSFLSSSIVKEVAK